MAYLIEDVLGGIAKMVTSDQPHLLGVGSILFMANAQSTIWGSGLLRPDQDFYRVHPNQIRALRGRKTLEHLRNLGIDVGDVPLGDPGILVDYLLDLPHFASLPQIYRLAVVPHYRSINSPSFQRFKDDASVALVDMRTDGLEPLEKIQQSEIVVSQSLHGLVFATALRKPCLWISDGRSESWEFKFNDWFSTCANPQNAPAAISLESSEWARMAEIRPSTIDREALLAAFPWTTEAGEVPPPTRLFRDLRSRAPIRIDLEWQDRPQVVPAAYYEETQDGRRRSRAINEAVARETSGWAERPYLVVAPPDMSLPDHVLHTAAEVMDAMPDVRILALLDRAQQNESDLLGQARSLGSLELFTGAAKVGGALVLRPGKRADFQRTMLAFY